MKKGLVCVLTLTMLVPLLLGCAKPPATAPTPPPAAPPATTPAKPPATTPAAPAPTPAPKLITLKAITAWPKSAPDNDKFMEWINLVNREGGGKVFIEYVGGPESIPQREQVPSLQKGIIDIVNTAGAYYNNIAPAAAAFNASRLRPEQEREKGFYNTMNQALARYNLMYLARTVAVAPVTYYWTNFEVKSLADFKGKKIRSTPTSNPIVEALGAAPVAMTPGEVYSAMEKRLIDAFLQPVMGSTSRAYYEVAKWIIDTPANQLPVAALMNLDTFNKLPKDVQDLLLKTSLQVEATVGKYFLDLEAKEVQILKDKGVTFVTLSAEDEKWLQDKHDTVYWDSVVKGDPEFGQKLKDIAFTEQPMDRGPDFWKNK